MLTLKTYTPANASGIVEDADGSLMSISFPGFKAKPIEFHGNTKRFFDLVMSQGQAVMHDPVYGDIVHSRANISFNDEAEVASFLKGKHDNHLCESARPSNSRLQALNFLGLLKQLLPV